ncbi:uncharacterized protein LOC114575246 [Exaiptasia diaphana]|uniref:Uncharacterized protein n=1 Tax=Exaiptasia diaphana TaxID=2652724 RepID=A0A913YM34_EXADI|nr:uncharacterized protein LOC114575246 [Exaiptasia diaphana]KXJ20462.1 hypothetical protein AC249_AIPGENE24042 [Exaiptasia diaphana]
MIAAFSVVHYRIIALIIVTSPWSFITAINIRSFQPEVVPLRSITTLTIATSDQLNASSFIQCRFNDISTAANLKGNLVFCNTPPMRSTDKVALHLEVDEKLHKANKPLRFHGPFKVFDISPKTAFPSQQIRISISGISCEDWMTFFVRFQSQNGTKITQKGICVNSTVTCYLPEFPAHALLRVGVTLSNRIVEWCPKKLQVKYPIDSKQSSIQDLVPDIQRKGAITFKVLPRDRFKNALLVDKDFKPEGFSVQYSPYNKPNQFSFLDCAVFIDTEANSFGAICSGAKSEQILVYPSLNNVVVGGKKAYEITTTCPGQPSCSAFSGDNDDSKMISILLPSIALPIVLLIIFAALYKYRWFIIQKANLMSRQTRASTYTNTKEQSQEVEMLMQFSGEHLSKPSSDSNKEQDVPLAVDNLLLQRTEVDLQAITSSGVCVVVDASFGFAQTMEQQPSNHYKANERNNDTSLDITDTNKSPEYDDKDSQRNNINASHFSDTNSATPDRPKTVFDATFPDEASKKLDQSPAGYIAETTTFSPIGGSPTHCTESPINKSVENDLKEVGEATGWDARPSEGAEIWDNKDTGDNSEQFSCINKMESSSSSEDEEVSLRNKLMAELKSRLRRKYRRSKIEINSEKS